MSRLVNDVMQTILPMAKKQRRIRFRRSNGRWLEFDLPPSKTKFNFRGDDNVYMITGVPDFEDGTGQALYMYFEGVPFPIQSKKQHPHLLEIGREAQNQQILQMAAEERGLQKALLLKKKDDKSLMMYLLIIGGVNILATLGLGFMMMNSLGISFI